MNLPDRIAKRVIRLGAAAGARAYSLCKFKRWRHPGTSITDDAWYAAFCAQAAKSKQAFARFRDDKRYLLYLGDDTADAGRYCLQSILTATPHHKSFFEKFSASDKFGSPRTFQYGKHGRFAATTLRYMKYLSDCENLCGSLDSKTLIEIGGGYGGLCKLIFDRFDVARYYLVDLPEALALARRFLTAALGEETVAAKLRFINAKNAAEIAAQLKPRFFDFGISAFAFSTCDKVTQKIYIDFVLNKCSFGYLVMDTLSSAFGVSSFALYEIPPQLCKEITVEEDPSRWWDDRVTRWTWKP